MSQTITIPTPDTIPKQGIDSAPTGIDPHPVPEAVGQILVTQPEVNATSGEAPVYDFHGPKSIEEKTRHAEALAIHAKATVVSDVKPNSN